MIMQRSLASLLFLDYLVDRISLPVRICHYSFLHLANPISSKLLFYSATNRSIHCPWAISWRVSTGDICHKPCLCWTIRGQQPWKYQSMGTISCIQGVLWIGLHCQCSFNPGTEDTYPWSTLAGQGLILHHFHSSYTRTHTRTHLLYVYTVSRKMYLLVQIVSHTQNACLFVYHHNIQYHALIMRMKLHSQKKGFCIFSKRGDCKGGLGNWVNWGREIGEKQIKGKKSCWKDGWLRNNCKKQKVEKSWEGEREERDREIERMWLRSKCLCQ